MMIDKDYTIRTLADMIRIDSTNPSLTPGSAGEAEMATCVSDALRKMGLECIPMSMSPDVSVW
jgi:acetylornithine deacetylase/succinyl-diaminopimelate desuccinylase-like protein